MIFGTILPAQNPVLLFPEPNSSIVTVQALIKLPDMGPRESVAFRAGLESTIQGTEEYGASDFLRWGNQTGSPVRIEIMPGFARVGITLPKDQLSTACSMIDSLLKRPELKREYLESWKRDEERFSADPWSLALHPMRIHVRDLRFEDVTIAFKSRINSSTTTFAIGGAFESSAASRASTRFGEWTPYRPPFVARDLSSITPLLKSPHQLTSVSLSGHPFEPNSETANAFWLAGFALGAGKGSCAFRVIREKLGLSYRQEVVFWPDSQGIRPKIVFLTAQKTLPTQVGEWIKTELLKDIDNWKGIDLARAQGMVRGTWQYKVGPNPLYLSPTQPLSDSIEDQTFLKLYWQIQTGAPWNPERISNSVQAVDLEQLKSAAKWIVQGANVHVILGKESELKGSSEVPLLGK